jgi:hypothetical protein
MIIIAKTQNGREYLYSNKTAVLCKSNEQAQALADFLNEHNATAQGNFKLKDGEKWHTYEIDKYSAQPPYKVKTTRGKIAVTVNY